MAAGHASMENASNRPYRSIREDPKYRELKDFIENCPEDKLERLKVCIRHLAAREKG
jgi:hypothetical protein